MLLLIIGITVYILFFVLFPGYAGIVVRRRWRRFREQIFKYVSVPRLEYFNISQGDLFTFNGQLESFKNDNIVWLKSESLSVCIDLEGQELHIISGVDRGISKTSWESVSSIVEGSSFFVAGQLEQKNGTSFLKDSEGEKLLVVISESKDKIYELLLERGRDKNEIWNSYAPYSYITGVLILIILSYFAYRSNSNKLGSYLLLLAAGTPFYFILPPGLYFYLKHRKLWETSVRWSILRDLRRLRGKIGLSDKFRSISKQIEYLSLFFYLLGYLLNTAIAGIILFNVFQLILFS